MAPPAEVDGCGWQLSKPLSMRILEDLLSGAERSRKAKRPQQYRFQEDQGHLEQEGQQGHDHHQGHHQAGGPSFLRGHVDHSALLHVLSLLPLKALARAQCVSRAFRDVAVLPEIRRAAFCNEWGLSRLVGEEPRSWAVLGALQLTSFVRKQPVRRGDTLSAIAVARGVAVEQLKRTNNITTDHSLASREHVFVPAAARVADLRGLSVRLERCPLASRDFAVVVEAGEEAGAEGSPGCGGAQAAEGADEEALARQRLQSLDRLSVLLGRCLKLDERAARFYLQEAKGDVRVAVALAREDSAWECTTGRAPHRSCSSRHA